VLYLVAVIVPPLAVLLCGKPFQAIINLILTIAFYVPGLIHAIFVVNNFYADRRADRIARALRK